MLRNISTFMAEESEEIILRVPSLLVPIFSLDKLEVKERPQPFFGNAPSETSVRITNCPFCDKAVSSAHINDHIKTHKVISSQRNIKEEQTILHKQSKLMTSTCAYSGRMMHKYKLLADSLNSK